eukprot:7388484-Prymnesium_polylepis.4
MAGSAGSTRSSRVGTAHVAVSTGRTWTCGRASGPTIVAWNAGFRCKRRTTAHVSRRAIA